MHDPDAKPAQYDSFEAYKKNNGTTINHFYEKKLLIKDLMNTDTGKKMAQDRHKFMEEFLERFHNEWEGKPQIQESVPVQNSKLVRDRIPEIIRRNGEEPKIRVADEEEHKNSLKEKLLEEAGEFIKNGEKGELADILEVIDGICLAHGFDREEIEHIKRKKRSERGGFEAKIVLEV